MDKELSLNETVREAITEALILLMKKKSLDKVTITELCRVAGVCRSSFYRNYSSVENVLLFYLQQLYAEFFSSGHDYEKNNAEADIKSFLKPRFAFIKENRDFFVMIDKHDLLYRIFENISTEIMQKIGGIQLPDSEYVNAYTSGACAGVVHQWIKNGFRESEEELTSLFADISNVKFYDNK